MTQDDRIEVRVSPFPLDWPVTWPRTPPGKRQPRNYKVDRTRACQDLVDELRRLEARSTTLSSNVPLRRSDGTPERDNYREPQDPGVAVYWETHERVRNVLACDRWVTVRENMRAVTLALEALRALERSGAGQAVERVFAGLSLPENATASADRPWWDELEVDPKASPDQIRAAYRELARVNRAYAAALPPR